MSTDLRSLIDDAPMRRFQWRAVTVCLVLNLIDGFDVLVMAFTGRAVAAEWGLGGAELGLLLSAGLVGMALGSIFLAPAADRIGRRPVIVAGLVVAGIGMLLSAAAPSVVVLGALRVLTGVGVGGVLACSSTIATEYASRRWRPMAVGLQGIGYAGGATLGGLLAVALIEAHGWRTVFLIGGVATLLAVPLVLGALPESLGFLLTRRPAGALDRVNALLRRLDAPTVTALPDPEPGTEPGTVAGGPRALLTPALRRTTVGLWAMFVLVMAGFYFVTSWTPTLLLEAGLSPSQGLTGGTLLNVGGIFGTVVLGALAARWPLRGVLTGYLLASGALLALLLPALSVLAVAFAVGMLVGVVVNGCVGGLYALAATSYPDRIRATGVGTAIGVGRIGAVAAPVAAGALLDAGASPQALYLGSAVIFVLSAVVLLTLHRTPAAPTTAR
ncbi:vannilate transporter VanK [Pseudonocardia sp. Ae168_Ps1]|uniref:MFS transporter n=1 Tax=unclassified Pseudonocardia TaxID=2619320 RepID=UPI00094AB6D5|nr:MULTISPECIES: MFS transporter [unclassified Pseudonocardia]OLL73577.1 vannilate transporter VanK [Pseudonocardia sp. Ae150A_Ps1]OLL79548.1 vannilate transporter VanK [Pseudonocardia sp. Ae168_Ps1]OLL86311.1 vannilate transporter VanK [Pseudonocardia sp. Ae263_Ps1]OLL93646.1 vannilate transporter VanK [Pseudonocardia sp. Ae356_Ps1]